jgi:hypothetical protein
MWRHKFNFLLLILILGIILTSTIHYGLLNKELDLKEVTNILPSTHTTKTSKIDKHLLPHQGARFRADTDNDGVDDNEDAFPNDPVASVDTDGDNLPDEIKKDGNSSLIEDTDDDNDGLPDRWEEIWTQYAIDYNIDYFFNPKNASDAMNDPDADGFSNLNEYIKDTNPLDSTSYPEFGRKSPIERDEWMNFINFLIIFISITMAIAIIIGIYIAKRRGLEEEFYSQTFGGSNGFELENRELHRKRYTEWQRRIGEEGKDSELKKPKYKLEIIGGPDEPDEITHDSVIGSGAYYRGRPHGRAHRLKSKPGPRFKGNLCLWCDKGITGKYIKRCPDMRTAKKRCPDGPFCSKKCLNEHLKIVPHYIKTNF